MLLVSDISGLDQTFVPVQIKIFYGSNIEISELSSSASQRSEH